MASSSRNVKDDSGDDDADIIIVGSGLTGLTAAYSILKRRIGLSVLILESNGGRILHEKNSQAFYGNFHQENIVKLVNDLKIPTEVGTNVDAKRLIFLTKNGPVIEEKSALISGQVFHFLKSLEEVSTDPRYKNYELHENSKELAKTSVDQLIKKSVYFSRAQLICRTLLYACCGIENLENVSALWFILMLHGAGGLLKKLTTSFGSDKRFFVKGGFVNIATELEKRIIDESGTIKCSESVVKIEINEDRVNVFTTSKKFNCDYVVIAVPPVASIGINVKPALPELLLKSQSLYVPAENPFFYATYRESFWSGNLSGSIIATADSGSILRMIYDATHPAGNKFCTIAGFLTDTSNSNSRNSIFEALNKCFQTRKASRCESYNVDNCSSGDAGNSMYALRPCSIRYHVNPMLLHLERIFFAASEYATNWPGTVDGAIETGETVARSIIFHARPQALDRIEIALSRRYQSRVERNQESSNHRQGIIRAHLMCLGLNVCLFFFLLRDAYGNI